VRDDRDDLGVVCVRRDRRVVDDAVAGRRRDELSDLRRRREIDARVRRNSPPLPIALGENDHAYVPPATSVAVAVLYQTCAPTVVPWLRVWSSCVQPPPPGAVAVILLPPSQPT
jgi:hypothetical protein